MRGVALINVLLTAQALTNRRSLRTPGEDSNPIDEVVSVLIPARNEESNIEAVLRDVFEQIGCPRLEVLVADDASTDNTAALVRKISSDLAKPVKLIELNEHLPEGWLGKPRACQKLADEASGSILVFLDADVRLRPNALRDSCHLLRQSGLALISPYPRQITSGALGRLIQPLLQWSWLTFLPLRLSESPLTPASLSAANGQFLLCDGDIYRAAGGHALVAGEVIEDVSLARAFKRAGFKVGMANGTNIATCEMYSSDTELIAGYSKSLWRAFGSPAGATLAALGLIGLYVMPAIGTVFGGRKGKLAGLVAYSAAVGQRVISARATGGRVWPDSLTQPVSIIALVWLLGRSLLGHRNRNLMWRGREVR